MISKLAKFGLVPDQSSSDFDMEELGKLDSLLTDEDGIGFSNSGFSLNVYEASSGKVFAFLLSKKLGEDVKSKGLTEADLLDYPAWIGENKNGEKRLFLTRKAGGSRKSVGALRGAHTRLSAKQELEEGIVK